MTAGAAGKARVQLPSLRALGIPQGRTRSGSASEWDRLRVHRLARDSSRVSPGAVAVETAFEEGTGVGHRDGAQAHVRGTSGKVGSRTARPCCAQGAPVIGQPASHWQGNQTSLPGLFPQDVSTDGPVPVPSCWPLCFVPRCPSFLTLTSPRRVAHPPGSWMFGAQWDLLGAPRCSLILAGSW